MRQRKLRLGGFFGQGHIHLKNKPSLVLRGQALGDFWDRAEQTAAFRGLPVWWWRQLHPNSGAVKGEGEGKEAESRKPKGRRAFDLGFWSLKFTVRMSPGSRVWD